MARVLNPPTPKRLIPNGRPFPPPTGPWLMAQRWDNLLFANYAYPASQIQSKLPDGLLVDTYNGQAWLSVVPFDLAFSLRGLHTLPLQMSFRELNLRTYVTCNGTPGVYFFCLDATDWLSVEAARSLFHLPYHNAKASIRLNSGRHVSDVSAEDLLQTGDWIQYESRRQDHRANPAVFSARYRPTSLVPETGLAPAGSLAHWLTERYCFFTTSASGQLYRCDIHHAPWPLQPAEAELDVASLMAAHGFSAPADEATFYYSHAIDVVSWPIHRWQPA